MTRIMPPAFFKESIDRVRQKMKAASYSDVELHITEWNFSLYDRNLLHDTMFMAPFVIYQTMNTIGDVEAMAYWSFTDVFEESVVPASPFYGGFGLISRDGLKKPGCYAFELMQKLGDELLMQGMVMRLPGKATEACSSCSITTSMWISCLRAETGRSYQAPPVMMYLRKKAAKPLKSR